MTALPTPRARRLMALKVGQTVFISGQVAGLVATAKRLTGHAYSREAVESGYLVTRTA